MAKAKEPEAEPLELTEPAEPLITMGGRYAVDGVDYVVTRYDPGNFTCLNEADEFEDAVEVRELVEQPAPPPLQVFPRSKLLPKISAPKGTKQ